jgi:DnaJ homologue, subfamily C, member 28, conserved domain
MGLMETIAENRIRAAQEEGLFSNLPGQGKPLNLEDDRGVPGDLRLTFKILKNASCLPVEMELNREIYNLRQLLRAAIDETARKELRRELNYLLLKEAISRDR